MTGATHASIGAALGAIIRKPGLAFAAGVVSHIIADILPHRDCPPKVEAALLTATLGFIIARYGINSPQFWGAAGAVSPDFEHLLLELGLIRPEDEIFPTHIDYGKWHGSETNERISQLLTFAAGMFIADKSK
ncbi:MAG TPA: hypothetical protein PLU88_05205 [Armatimonadota bacterium]|nr:hypothetical protein [Armatimonadota bacterium]HPP74507.1 hypothetical protein [Armatimonadota bacterium]